MRRHFSIPSLTFLFVAALYVSAPASATPEEPVPATAAPEASPVEPAAPHLALLLPLKSPAFAKAAEAVKQGFLAAANHEPGSLPVIVYPCADESAEIAALYQQALSSGAQAVAGPLTRNGVVALAAETAVTVPTLALNVQEEARQDVLFFFGLPAEAEARQIAQRATNAGLLSAFVVSTSSPLSRRLAQAFADEWVRLGGILRGEIVYAGDMAPIRTLPEELGGMVFLAAEPDKARLLRPYIHSMLPVYATSQVFSGNANTLVNYDLADVRFVDMPWLLQPDHPAVMVYPRPAPPLKAELERLYALGIDAYRLLQVLLKEDLSSAVPLDGVTGQITLDGHVFRREATPAIIRQGQAVPVETRRR